MIGGQSDRVIMEVFSNMGDSVILDSQWITLLFFFLSSHSS